MRVLVTGGNGFIGGYVSEFLTRTGHAVVVMDRHCEPGSSVYAFHLGDVRDYASVLEAVYHVDGVIHLAGVLGTQETIGDPTPAIETNIMGSMNVFRACVLHNKPAVYIAVGNHWMNNPYSISKTTAERFALMMNKERGARIAVVRGLNAYGPRQKIGPVRKIMPNFIIPALKDETITVYGDGSQVMDMIYVEDLAEILCRALLVDHGVYDRVFEAGTGRPTTVRWIAEQVVRIVGRGSIVHVPMRPGEPEQSLVIATPATLGPLYPEPSSLGYISFMRLEYGIERTAAYYAKSLGLDLSRRPAEVAQ